MRYKKIMILTIILTFLLVVSAVSAVENATDDIVGADASDDVVSVEETTDEVVSVENDNQVITEGNDSDVGSFADLEAEINNVEEGGVLNLTKDYKYVSGSNEGIQINKAITIDGQGHTLDGNQLSRMFVINANNVVLKNISFINGFIDSDHGGAIYWKSMNGCVFNSTFKNCHVSTSKKGIFVAGGAIFWESNNGNITNCSFINNGVSGPTETYGGAISFKDAYYCSIANSVFINNYNNGTRVSVGGAVIWWDSDYGAIYNSYFFNNSAESGAAIGIYNADYFYSGYCNFTNNTIMWYGISGISNCSYFSEDFGNINLVYDTIIIKRNLNLLFKNETLEYSKESNFTVFLTNDENNVLDKLIIVSIKKDDILKEFNLRTSENGIVSIFEKLDVGIWNVTAVFEGDDNYAPCNATATITVLPASSSLTIDDVNATVGHEVTLVAKVSSDLTINEGSVIFFEDSTQIGESEVSNGTATLIYVPTSAGEHNITAIFNSSNYLSSNDTAKLLVEYSAIEILVDNGVVDYNMDITVKISNPENLTVNNGIVVFFDGETQIGESAVSNGFATITYVPTTAGEHNVTAKYKLDNSEDSTNSILFNVSKAEIDLNIGYIDTVYFSNPSNFAVNVLSNSKGVNEGNIKYYVNGKYIGMLNVYDGQSSLSYVTNTTGSFKLLVVYNETDNYFAKNASTTFYVNQMPTTLTGESVIFDEQQYKTFTTELKDNNANGVYNQTVRIELIKYSGESATFTGVSDGNGITFYDVGTLAGGMWYVAGTYSGNENYIGSNFADKFIVVRLDTTTEIEEIQNAQVNHNYKLKANIHDENGKLVKEGILQFYLDGVDIGSIDLSENQGHQSALREGVLGAVNPMFEYELGADASDLYLNYVPTKAGKHTLTAVYEGTTIYKSSNSTTSFVVSNSNKKGTEIVASDLTTAYNGGKYLVGTLTDVFGKAISGVKVTVVFNGKTTKYTTDKKGQFKVSTNGLAPKTYTAKITFAGNSKYDKTTKTVKVTVKKASPKLTAAQKTFKKSVKTKSYAVTLKTNQNKVMKKAKVTLKVNGKTFSATTNNNGQATFKITNLSKKGTFAATVKYAGNSYYYSKTVNTKITVK